MRLCTPGALGEEWGCPSAAGSCPRRHPVRQHPPARDAWEQGSASRALHPQICESCGCSDPEWGCPRIPPARAAGAGCRRAAAAGAVPQQKGMFFLRNFKGSLKSLVQIS